MKISRTLPLIAFIIMLLIVILNTRNSDYIVVENRYKSDFPELTLSTVRDRTYQQGIENYFSDQVVAEKKLIEIKTQLAIKIGTKTIRNTVMIGDDMFFSTMTLKDINGELLTDEELQETLFYLNEIDKYYSDLGYEFYFAVGPNKASIYGDRLPTFPVAPYRRMHQLYDSLETETFITTINLYDVLVANRKTNEEQLYFSYDSHWNFIGGYIASEELIKTLYPNLSFNYEEYKNSWVYDQANNTDLANIIGVGNIYYDYTYKPEEVTNYYKDFIDLSNDSSEELIVIRDSYFNAVAPSFEYVDVSKKYVSFLSGYKEGYIPTKSQGKVLMLVVERNLYPSIQDAYETLFNEPVAEE